MKHNVSAILPLAIIPNGLNNFLRLERKGQKVPTVTAINSIPRYRTVRELPGGSGADSYTRNEQNGKGAICPLNRKGVLPGRSPQAVCTLFRGMFSRVRATPAHNGQSLIE